MSPFQSFKGSELNCFYCAFQKHANSEVQKPPSQLRFLFASIMTRSQAMNLETQEHTQWIEIHQSQTITF